MQLPDDVRALFDNIASGTNHTAYEWFIAEIPPSSMHDAEQIRTLVNGGTVDLVREIGDRGAAGGSYYETDTIEIADRDFSRIESGMNGGEYTPDNVVLENASVNRARGGDNMSDADFADAQSSLEFDSELMNMDGAVVNSSMSVGEMADVAEPVAETLNVVPVDAGSLLGDIGETVLDGLLPATMGFHVASHIADQFDDPTDKLGYGSLGAGLTVLACMTPPGQIVMAGYVGWNVCKLVGRGISAIDRHLQTN